MSKTFGQPGQDGDERSNGLAAFSRTEVWLTGALAAIVSFGIPDDLDPVGLVFVGVWATFHFVVISITVFVSDVGSPTVVIATLVALVALFVVPRAIDELIEDDPSSTRRSSTSMTLYSWLCRWERFSA